MFAAAIRTGEFLRKLGSRIFTDQFDLHGA
jgi:hypothetical protein